MRVNKIRALHGYRTRHYSASKPSALIPNLVKRNFDVSRPNTVWVTDITYIRTWEGWLHLAIVMDLFSRKIVGWSTRPTIHRQLGVIPARTQAPTEFVFVGRDADLDVAVAGAAALRLYNTGQGAGQSARIHVEAPLAYRFADRLHFPGAERPRGGYPVNE